jgi:serine/threonine protein phosphatase 1
MGNHERMMLDFLDDPDRHGARWITAGGDATLASFQISPWARAPMPHLAAQLREALTPDLETWIKTLPLYWQSGNVAATHAGASPDQGLEEQPAHRLLWGAKRRSEGPRQDGLYIVQGHTIVAHAGLERGRVMIDTGAWRSGRLSAAWFDVTGLSFIEVNMTDV